MKKITQPTNSPSAQHLVRWVCSHCWTSVVDDTFIKCRSFIWTSSRLILYFHRLKTPLNGHFLIIALLWCCSTQTQNVHACCRRSLALVFVWPKFLKKILLRVRLCRQQTDVSTSLRVSVRLTGTAAQSGFTGRTGGGTGGSWQWRWTAGGRH